MDECDLESEEPAVRLLVDKLDALLGQALQLALEIAHLVGDVMHAGPSAGEELPDRSLFSERSEQLDATFTDADGGGLYTLLGDRVAMLYLGTEEPSVRFDRLVEILDGNPEMVNPLRLHARGS
jgi:hypothetical protein